MGFDPNVLAQAARQREIGLTTYGRKTGRPHRVTIWISGDGSRLFVRSGGGLGRDWTRNVTGRPQVVLHVGGLDVPVLARHVADPNEARAVTQLVRNKYGPSIRGSAKGEPLTPGEEATFELLPAAG
jgi:deazaflavin-dependent oxidoreductase (nitroreductase family)